MIASIAMSASIGRTAVAVPLDAAAVDRSIARGVEYLRRTQNDRGGWEEYGGMSCGMTALTTLALLNCGLEADDPAIVRAMQYLRRFSPNETYSVALQTLVFCELKAVADLPRIRRNVQWLTGEQTAKGDWNYGRGRGSGDPSNAQFAILALGAAEDVGIEVPTDVFRKALEYWLPRQDPSGGWRYGASRQLTGSMTCAGIASVLITRSKMATGTSAVRGDQIQCCGAGWETDPVELALQWLGKNFTTRVNPGGDSQTVFYYLYALERVGRLSGRRFIGPFDWYREGAARLLEVQDEFLGFWRSDSPLEPPGAATSFALLFLAKGKRQVVVGHLQYAADDRWRTHPHAIRPLVRHIERDWSRDLTWQTVLLDRATVDDLLQAPVIVITGNDRLDFTPTQSDVLSDYLAQGGTLVFDADAGMGCGDDTVFHDSVDGWVRRWTDGIGLQPLPPEHAVWSAQRKVALEAVSDDQWIEGVQACCRTSVFYSPSSLSCRWSLGDALLRRNDPMDPVARTKIQNAISIGENIVAYATGRQLQEKLESRIVLEGAAPEALDRGAIRIATLGINAGGDGADRAVSHAAQLIVESLPIPIASTAAPVGFDDEVLRDVMYLWVHGRDAFEFTPDQRETLGRFVDRGGMILGSSVCGSDAFADSFRAEVERISELSPLGEMAPDHPVMRVPGGFDLSQVTVRTPGKTDRGRGGDGLQTRRGAPVLESATCHELIGVFFSPLDISCALESPNSVQCPGYSTEDAAKIVTNWILYGLSQ